MRKIQHQPFEAVVTGHNDIRILADLVIYKAAVDELALTVSRDILEESILYKMYQYQLCEAQDFLLEV